MADVFIYDALRTPRGRGKAGKGGLANHHPQELLAQTLNHLAARTKTLKDIQRRIIELAAYQQLAQQQTVFFWWPYVKDFNPNGNTNDGDGCSSTCVIIQGEGST